MRNETKDKVLAYESKLESSFDLVLREAEELYQGQGRLMWFTPFPIYSNAMCVIYTQNHKGCPRIDKDPNSVIKK